MSSRTVPGVVLLLLDEAPGHGYELCARLERVGFTPNTPSTVYRALAALEKEELVSAAWTTDGAAGPARRVFAVSPDGLRLLDGSCAALKSEIKSLDGRLARFVRQRLGVISQRKGDYIFRVNAAFSVRANTESAARRKLEHALAARYRGEADVQAVIGEVSIEAQAVDRGRDPGRSSGARANGGYRRH